MKHPKSKHIIKDEKRDIFRYVNHKPEISAVIDAIAHPFAAGTFYYFIHCSTHADFSFVSDSINNVLGYNKEDFTPGFLAKILHPDDKNQFGDKELISLSFLKKQISVEEISSLKVAFLLRLKHAKGKYITLLHQARPIRVSEAGKILETIYVHTDISYLNVSVDNRVSIISKNNHSQISIDATTNKLLPRNCLMKNFSSRELEIIKYVGQGMNVNEIADILFISPHTVSTHKKNILRKSKCQNFTELIARCIKEGLA